MSAITIGGKPVTGLAQLTTVQRIKIASLVMTTHEMAAAFMAEDLKDAAFELTGVRPFTEKIAVERIRAIQDAELSQ